ncbi:MAG: hypothetical protein IPK73_04325 [Candidatus Obscuribacter sp.]|nr:hypothetical protein [Candidatus Obscuribacter sp.]MBL8085131.1 hypothetical protein [Candidatus Obscuribacter sp.]
MKTGNPVLFIMIAGVLYLSYALYAQKGSMQTQRGPEMPGELAGDSPAVDETALASLSVNVPKKLSEQARQQIAYLKQPIKVRPFSSHHNSLSHYSYLRILDRSQEGDRVGEINRLKEALPKQSNQAFASLVLQILADGEKNDPKNGLKHALAAVDLIDRDEKLVADKKMPPLALLVPFVYGARFALMLDDEAEACALAQESLTYCRQANDFALKDMEALYYSAEKQGADFALFNKTSESFIESLKAGKEMEFRAYSDDLLKSLGNLNKYSYHVLNARLAGVLMLEMTQKRIAAIEEAKSIRDRARECGDAAVCEDAGKIADRLEHP